MRKRKKRAQMPMLYIDQPDFVQPTAKMQTSYRSPKRNKEKSEVEQQPSVSDRKKKGTATHAIPSLTDTQGTAKPKNKKPSTEDLREEPTKKRKRKKPFSEMTIEERVSYYASLPSHVPKMKCEVYVEQNKYRGVITDYHNGMVYMKTTRRPYEVELSIDDIEDIVIAGF